MTFKYQNFKTFFLLIIDGIVETSITSLVLSANFLDNTLIDIRELLGKERILEKLSRKDNFGLPENFTENINMRKIEKF